jgi:hypothetical protein
VARYAFVAWNSHPLHLTGFAGAPRPLFFPICLSFGGPDEGKVYFWDHEEEPPQPSYANCHLIAGSFDEFIAGLHD